MTNASTMDNDECELTISVVGVGGAACKGVETFPRDMKNGMNLIAINTDEDSLKRNDVPIKLCIGRKQTDGSGTGGDVQLGKDCMEKVTDVIKEKLRTSDIVFVIAGMGGGTGTGGAPVVASIAKDAGAYVFGVAIMPFMVEGNRREVAKTGLKAFKRSANNVIAIDNNDLLGFPKDLSITEAFGIIDNVVVGLVLNVINNVKIKKKVEAKAMKRKAEGGLREEELLTYYLMDEVEAEEGQDIIKVDVTGIAKTCRGGDDKAKADDAKKIARMMAEGKGYGMPRDEVFITKISDFTRPDKMQREETMRVVQPLLPPMLTDGDMKNGNVMKKTSMTLNDWITFGKSRRMDNLDDDEKKMPDRTKQPERTQTRLDHAWV